MKEAARRDMDHSLRNWVSKIVPPEACSRLCMPRDRVKIYLVERRGRSVVFGRATDFGDELKEGLGAQN